ncbi:MAG: hypothetical protein ACRCWQ_04530 [Bacilli bacterium]
MNLNANIDVKALFKARPTKSTYLVLSITLSALLLLGGLFALYWYHIPSFIFGPREVTIAGQNYMSRDVSEGTLQTRIDSWKQQPLILEYQKMSVPLSMDAITFDITSTITEAKETGKSQFRATVNVKVVEELIRTLTADRAIEINQAALTQFIVSQAGNLTVNEKPVRLFNFVNADKESAKAVSEKKVDIPTVFAGSFTPLSKKPIEVTIPARSEFSFNNAFNKKLVYLNDAEKSYLATIIYQALLSTNFSISERAIHDETFVPNLTQNLIGYDTIISPKHDLKIFNSNINEYVLKIQQVNGKLVVSIIGPTFEYKYEPIVGKNETIDTKKYVTTYGNEGQSVRRVSGFELMVFRQAKNDAGEVVSIVPIGRDYYPPTIAKEARYYIVPLPPITDIPGIDDLLPDLTLPDTDVPLEDEEISLPDAMG